MFKIGTFKNGQQIANEVFAGTKQEVKKEFLRMYKETEFCPSGTDDEPETEREAWDWKRFSEDTNNVAVFKCKKDDPCLTIYTYQGTTKNQL